MFGFGCPRPRPPPEYAPKSFQPVSSVMSMTILGFFCCCATAGILAIVTAANSAPAPRQIVLIMRCFLRAGYLKRGGRLCPRATAPPAETARNVVVGEQERTLSQVVPRKLSIFGAPVIDL